MCSIFFVHSMHALLFCVADCSSESQESSLKTEETTWGHLYQGRMTTENHFKSEIHIIYSNIEWEVTFLLFSLLSVQLFLDLLGFFWEAWERMSRNSIKRNSLNVENKRPFHPLITDIDIDMFVTMKKQWNYPPFIASAHIGLKSARTTVWANQTVHSLR